MQVRRPSEKEAGLAACSLFIEVSAMTEHVWACVRKREQEEG
jgi:hypothetical protein